MVKVELDHPAKDVDKTQVQEKRDHCLMVDINKVAPWKDLNAQLSHEPSSATCNDRAGMVVPDNPRLRKAKYILRHGTENM